MLSKKQPKIFIVEDTVNNHQLFLDAFEASGFEVCIRQTAENDFVEEVNDFKPDIISMDLMIGKVGAVTERDGFHAIELLKDDERTKNIPIIVLTNFFEEGKVQRAKDLGAVDFIILQGQTISKIPDIFKRYLDKPKKYLPTHPMFRE